MAPITRGVPNDVNYGLSQPTPPFFLAPLSLSLPLCTNKLHEMFLANCPQELQDRFRDTGLLCPTLAVELASSSVNG